MADIALRAVQAAGSIDPARRVTDTTSASGISAGSAGFEQAITQAMLDTSSQLKRAETVSIDAMMGNASVQQVVEEVMAAEQSLQAAIAVRDKAVAAYLEISRMAI